jgi:hypothetical protein
MRLTILATMLLALAPATLAQTYPSGSNWHWANRRHGLPKPFSATVSKHREWPTRTVRDWRTGVTPELATWIGLPAQMRRSDRSAELFRSLS